MKLFAPLLLLAIAPALARACTCAVRPACQSTARDGIEFVGTVTDVRAADEGVVAVDVAISEAFGPLQAKKLTVYTNSGEPACGYPFRRGVKYFVSTHYQDSNLWTGLCSATRPAAVAAALIRQLRAMQAGKPPAQIFGIVGVEPRPGVEFTPTSTVVTAVGKAGEFHATTAADGSYEFSRLPASTYHLRVELPKDLAIRQADERLHREYELGDGKICEADFPLYLKGSLEDRGRQP